MKRRDFLIAGASVAGGLAAPFARAQEVKPCAPQTFGIQGGTQVTDDCAAPVGVPAWLGSMQVGAWSTIANGAGAARTLQQVAYGPLTFTLATGNSATKDASQVLGTWSGATMDSDRKEYVIVANGGHGDYPGNEAYAIALWEDTPYWYRLNDPSPSSVMSDIPEGAYSGDGEHMKYRDGRSRAMHNGGTFHHIPGTGKIWFTMQNSYQSGSGNSGFGIVSFNRAFPGMATKGSDTPLAWANSPGPWEFPSVVGSAPATRGSIGSYYFGLSSYDPVTRKIWAIGGTQAGTYWNVDPFNRGLSQNFSRGDFNCVEPGWFQVCPDKRWAVRGGTAFSGGGMVPGRSPYELGILNLDTGKWADKITGPSSAFPWSDVRYEAHASVYYNGSIYVMDPLFFGNRILKCTLPSSIDGDWSNVWSVIQVAGGPPQGGSGGLWTRMQLVDFGSAAALVVPTAWNQGTYVYRLS